MIKQKHLRSIYALLNRSLLTLCLCSFLPQFSFSQTDLSLQNGWRYEMIAGLDLTGVGRLNPKLGSGGSQFSIGAAFNGQAIYSNAKNVFNLNLQFNYGVQKTSPSDIPPDVKIPFQKNIDQIRINSRFGHRASIVYPGLRWLYTVDFSFDSQFSTTYENNYISEPDPLLVRTSSMPISRFLSPATILFSLGIEHQVSDQFSIYYSPGAFKGVIVSDEAIAQQFILDDSDTPVTLHGNPIEFNDQGTIKRFANADIQIGSLLRTKYEDTFADESVFFNSYLTLYSNYLNQPEKIDVDFINEIGFTFFDGFQLTYWTNLFYDFDIPLQKTENFRILENQFVRGVSFTQRILIRYRKTF